MQRIRRKDGKKIEYQHLPCYREEHRRWRMADGRKGSRRGNRRRECQREEKSGRRRGFRQPWKMEEEKTE